MIQKLTSLLQKIKPDTVRKFFYNLPLLVNWLPGITFEKEENWIQMSERSMGLSLLFFTGIAFTSVVYFFTARFTPGSEQYIPNMVGFALHSVTAGLYLSFSAYFTAAELLNKKVNESLNSFFRGISHSFRDLFA